MEASYYFWKWADNDLPGRPAEIMSALNRGETHPALQSFNPKRLLSTLRHTASRRPKSEQWHWDVVAEEEAPKLARCVYVTRSSTKDFEPWDYTLRFWHAFEPLILSGCVEQTGLLIPGGWLGLAMGLRPKLNCFSTMQKSGGFYDVAPADLPALLRSLDPGLRYCVAALGNPQGHFVQCEMYEEDECVVEWAYKQSSGKEETWDHLRARDPKRPVAQEEAEREREVASVRRTGGPQYYALTADKLRFEEAVAIFQAFARGEPRPANWLWCEIPEEPEY